MAEQRAKFSFSFHPKLLDTRRGHTWQDLAADTVAGITVGMAVLLLAMVFVIASGVKLGVGIFTAVLVGFLFSALLGGTKVSLGEAGERRTSL